MVCIIPHLFPTRSSHSSLTTQVPLSFGPNHLPYRPSILLRPLCPRLPSNKGRINDCNNLHPLWPVLRLSHSPPHPQHRLTLYLDLHPLHLDPAAHPRWRNPAPSHQWRKHHYLVTKNRFRRNRRTRWGWCCERRAIFGRWGESGAGRCE